MTRKGGIGSKAHRGAAGMVSGLGGAPEWPNRRRRAPGPKLEDDDDGGCSGPFWSRETTRRTRAEQRSFGRRRGGETVAVAARALVGGDGLHSVAGGETEERGGGRSRERGRSERGSGRRVASPGVEEGGNQAGGGQARWRCSPPSCFVRWHGKKTGMPPGGWAAQCWAVQVGFGERQVSYR